MVIQYNPNIHACDMCKKHMKKWEYISLAKRWYTPGNNFDNFTSDIDTHVEKVAELCPECMDCLVRFITSEDKEEQ